MATYRGAPDRPADVLAALPPDLAVFDPSSWGAADSDEYEAERRWNAARFAYVARWGVGKVELLRLEHAAHLRSLGVTYD
jgi:hypothetical protein